MSIDIQELESQIKEVQTRQKQLFDKKKFSELTQQQRQSYYCNNQKLGELAYKIYLKLKEANHPGQAAGYFYLACECRFKKALDEFNAAKETDAKATLPAKPIKGSAKKFFHRGLQYLLGIGEIQNRANALYYFKNAAKQRYASAQFILGEMYDTGEGVKQNKKEAVKWYRLSEEQGDASAQFKLGEMYDIGEGVKQNRGEAVTWYRLSAERGGRDAQVKLYTLSKDYPIAAYHFAMLAADFKKIVPLIHQSPSLLKYLLWDFKRSQSNDTLQNLALSAISLLFDTEQFVNQHRAHTIEFVLQFLSYQLESVTLDLKYLSLLRNLNISSMNKDHSNRILQLMGDIWYYLKEDFGIKEQQDFSCLAAEVIRQTLYHLASMAADLEDAPLLRLCTNILIKNIYSESYGVSLDEKFNFKDLLAFLGLSQLNKSPEEMNKILEINLIKEQQVGNPKAFLMQLNGYLHIHAVTKNAPFLKLLKNTLTDRLNANAIENLCVKDALRILTEICKKSKKILKQTSKHPNSLFSIQNIEEKKFVELLAQQRFQDILYIMSNTESNKVHPGDKRNITSCS